MPLPPFRKLNAADDELFSRGQDNAAEPWRVLAGKQLLITGESVLFLEKTVAVPSDWTAVTAFTNGWVNYDTSTNPGAQYRKTVDGMVEVFGVIKNGVVGNAAFTLPTGYRPGLGVLFSVVSNGAFGLVSIQADGAVVPAVGNNAYFDFGMMRFSSSVRTPAPASCWPIQIPCALKTRPNGVIVSEARETASNAYVAAGLPDWDWDTQQGQNFVVIKNVPFLPPGVSYNLTFAVFGVT